MISKVLKKIYDFLEIKKFNMPKKIYTIQSHDKNEFDKQVNELLELGGEFMDNGYQIINGDDGFAFTQVVVFKNGKENGSRIKWYENGQKKYVKNYKDGKKDTHLKDTLHLMSL